MEGHIVHDVCDEVDERSLPLSPAQLGVYFEHLRDESGNRFNIGQVTTIAGDLDVAVFRRAAADVIAQTPALQMAIVVEDGELRQRLVDRSMVEVPLYDLRGEADPEAARAQLLDALAFTPFDLTRDPLFRWVLIKTGEACTDWVQVCHHIVADGWSGQRLAGQVGARYTALVSGSEAEVGGPEPYAAHIREEMAYAEGGEAERDRAYWLDLLSGIEFAAPFEVRGHTAPAISGRPFLRQSLCVSGDELAALTALAEALGVTIAHVVMGAVAVWEAMRSGRSDIVLGTPLLGRLGAGSRSVVSMSSNVGHLRVRGIWRHSVGSLLTEIRSQQRASLRHQRYRYEDLRRELAGAMRDSQLSRVQVNVMSFDYGIRFGGLRGQTQNLSNGPVDGLSLVLYPQPDGDLYLELNGSSLGFDQAGLERAAAEILHALSQFPELTGETSLSEVSLTPAGDLARIGVFNATGRRVAGGVLPDLLSE
ncbi:MAG: condensation domain-containing protein, partial [Roseovarius sp.]